MPDHDEREPVETETDTLPPPATVSWHTYKLRKATVNATAINGKYCRVQELGDGWHSVEVEGFEPLITEEPVAICLHIAELSAHDDHVVRRFTSSSGEETYR